MDKSEQSIRIDELSILLNRITDPGAVAIIKQRQQELLGTDRVAIEKQFHNAMIGIYKTARNECNYNDTRFLQLVSSIGGLAAAKQLIAKPGGTDGFARLYECGRLDLSVEAHVLLEQYALLFTEEEKVLCRDRLMQYGYEVK